MILYIMVTKPLLKDDEKNVRIRLAAQEAGYPGADQRDGRLSSAAAMPHEESATRKNANSPAAMQDFIKIDGSFGEGGGQIVRSSLTLSLVTGKPFAIERIRAGRHKPGLMRQHLTAVNAAAEISGAEVEGAAVGSARLLFRPGRVRPGDYAFRVGTAGSTTLVFQTILPALMIADAPSRLTLEGGTHNPFAPSFRFPREGVFPVDQPARPQGRCPSGSTRLLSRGRRTVDVRHFAGQTIQSPGVDRAREGLRTPRPGVGRACRGTSPSGNARRFGSTPAGTPLASRWKKCRIRPDRATSC